MTGTTQMISGTDCPVCGVSNAARSGWCADCGFRLDSAPGDTVQPSGGYALLGGAEPLPLKAGENVVGRIQADVFLTDVSISRRHAVVIVADDGVFVRDEGSSNGTKIGGHVLEAGETHAVEPGQTIQFGAVVLRLSAADGSAVDAPPGEEAVERHDAGVLRGDLGIFPLKEGANSIGRRPGNDVVLDDAYVSGLHAVLTIRDGAAFVVDSGSSNGTFLAEERLAVGTEVELTAGQEIRFGRQLMRYAPELTDAEAAKDAAGD